jgi:hypothetical protein
MLTGMLSQREFMPVCSLDPLLIITIKLVLIPCDGLPPMLMYQNLYPYLHQNVEHVIISFDFSTPDSIGNYVQEPSPKGYDLATGLGASMSV